MKLGEFIKRFSHNNIIRLWHKCEEGGHQVVLDTTNDVSMDWQVNLQQGKFRHYVDNEVTCIIGIDFGPDTRHHDAINIVIERLDDQPFLEEVTEDRSFHES